MIESSTNDALRELIARGLIAAPPAPPALPRGNRDRRDTSRSSWLVTLPDGNRAKLTLGRSLADLADRHAALARACPAIIPALLHHTRLANGEALLETFFAGVDLESAAANQSLPAPLLRPAVAAICASLAATEQTSTEPARAAEWSAWCEQLVALPVWPPADKSLLQDILLPALYPRLSRLPPVTRWTNGDFLPANILVNTAGESRLIDAEFAGRTHFFAEDAVRFQVLSPLGQNHPELLTGLWPPCDLPWHLYFWLRQFQLEVEHNTSAYMDRVRLGRLGLIRRLVEHVLGVPLTGWSTDALVVQHCVEDTRWVPGDRTITVSGWCHIPIATRLRSIIAHSNAGRLAIAQPTARPDVQKHLGGDPQALLSGFSLDFAPPADAPIIFCAMVDHGTVIPFHTLPAHDLPRRALCQDPYPAWAAQHDPDPAAPTPRGTASGPLVSILLPVYRTPDSYLRDCINSVLTQHYPHWELCVVDDGSASPELTDRLHRFSTTDHRIRIKVRPDNGGISRATNDALAMARGDFVLFLDHDDLLRPHTLAEFANRLAREPDLDALYSDEDKVSADGQRLIPLLKPEFSPEFLLGVMYIGHALCVRTSLARSVGGLDSDYDGIQDYEFFLRLTERTSRIRHLPRILYHWRQSSGSSALHGNIKGDMDQKQALAVQAHLHRCGDHRITRSLGGHRVQLEALETPMPEVIVVPDPAKVMRALREAAANSTAEVLVAISAGLDLLGDDAQRKLAGLAARPDSACVAPLLLSSSHRVHESGRNGTGPVMHGFHPEDDGHHGSLRCNREVDGLATDCIAIKRALIGQIPPTLDDDWPAVCRHLRQLGLYHRVCAQARVQFATVPDTTAASATSPDQILEFYNPHFDPRRGDYTLAADYPSGSRTESPLRFYFDQPTTWDALPRCLIIRGWCFAGPNQPIAAIRLRAGDLILNGVVSLPRPDVKTALPAAPNEDTGFEIRGTLPGGQIEFCIEAQSTDGSWHQLVAGSTTVPQRFLPLWLGGGDWRDLMFFQMPAHMAHPPTTVRMEKYPAPTHPGHPRFAIVTPSFNQARFLAETMHSVLEQNAAVDYVVQDGGSADASVEIIRRFAAQGEGSREQGEEKTESVLQLSTFNLQLSTPGAPRLVAWESAPDAGQADAIAKGFAKTSGAPDDVMAWINSDDFYLPGALAYVADYFAAHPEVDVIYGHRIVVDENSREIGRWFLPKHDPEVLRLNDFVPQETLFWRRRIWDRIGGLDTSFRFAMDWDLLLRFQAAEAKIVRVPSFLACFRVHTAQKTSAVMHSIGQEEITRLRERTQGRPFPAQELERSPRLLRYLRRSAFIEFLWRRGFRAP